MTDEQYQDLVERLDAILQERQTTSAYGKMSGELICIRCSKIITAHDNYCWFCGGRIG